MTLDTLPLRENNSQPNPSAGFGHSATSVVLDPSSPARESSLTPALPQAQEAVSNWTEFQPTLDLPTRHGLTELKRQIAQDDAGKWDLLVPKDRLILSRGQLILPEEHLDEHPELLSLSPWATAQVCHRLGIPAPYFLRCSNPLRDAQFNYWAWQGAEDPDEEQDGKADTPRPWLLRCKEQAVRAVLSDRYRPLDNADLVGTLVPILEDRFEVRGIALTPESFHLRLVDPRLAREVLPDDRLMVGVHVANSETGRRSVTVDALVWRLVCLNGMVRLVRGKSLLRQRHVSWDRPRFADALNRAVCEAVTAGAGLIDRLQAATREPVPDVEGVIRAIGQQAALTQSVQDRVKQALLSTPPPQQERVYGLVQALTYTAQSLAPDDRYDLEVLAGRLLDEGLPAPVKADALIRRPNGGRMRGNDHLPGG